MKDNISINRPHITNNDVKYLSENPFPVEQKIVEVLLISPFDEDHQNLRRILHHTKWQQSDAHTQAEALAFVEDHPPSVAICESELPDGTWKDLLFRLAPMKHPPAVVVTSRLADEVLWSEVLHLGGYNVLAKPLDSKEVCHVVTFAWLSWKSQWDAPRVRVQSACQ